MSSSLNKLKRRVVRLCSHLPADPRVGPITKRLLEQHRKNEGKISGSLTGRVLAVQGVEDPIFYGVLSALAIELHAQTGIRPFLLQVRSLNGAIGAGKLAQLARSWPVTALFNAQWRRAQDGFITRLAYCSGGWRWPLAWVKDRIYGRELQRRIQKEGGLSKLEVDGILIGDLVIDTYLRFRPAVTVDVEDPFLGVVLTQALRDLRLAQAWFARSKPVLYLSSYSTYVMHGVAVRVALAHNVPVWVLCSTTIGKRLSVDDPYHGANGSNYRRNFDALQDSVAALKRAEELLEGRLNGGTDPVTSYMRQSAYANSYEDVPNVSNSVVIFLHDFFDSPHVYAELVFDDFWQWICLTIQTLTEAGISFFVKPHPNQIAGNVEVLERLKTQFPGLNMLSTSINNRQLVDAGMRAGVTVYGTVGHELAYLGIPVICCARHPHHAFDFCRTARSVDEYKKMLSEPFIMPLSRDEMRRQALKFYYAHNLYGTDESIRLRARFGELWRVGSDDTADPAALSASLATLMAEPGWESFVQELIKDMSAASVNTYDSD